MTRADKPAFLQAFNRLAKSGVISDVDAATVRVYFEALVDLPLWAVEAAALHLQRHPPKWFSTGAWCEASVSVWHAQRRRDDAALLSAPKQLAYHCADCRDTGWLEAGERVAICSCRPLNPQYQRLNAQSRLGQDGEAAPTPDEAKRLTDGVRDFKRIGSGVE